MTLRNPDGSLTCICHEHRSVCDCVADSETPKSDPDKPRLDLAKLRLSNVKRMFEHMRDHA